MSFRSFLENTGNKLVVVDIQPEYHTGCGFLWNKGLANYLQQYNEILILFVGAKEGLSRDTKASIANYYLKNGVPREKIYQMKWFDKGYNFFRDMMDAGCYMREDIIRVIRHMLKNNIHDWRKFSDEDIKKFSRIDLDRETLELRFMGIPELAYAIGKWRGSTIIGGGLEECLEEVLLLADAMKLNFDIDHDFCY